MKRFITFSLLAVCACILSGCGGSSPDDVALDFMKAVAKPDLKAAAEMATPETAALLNMAASMGGEGLEAHPNAKFKVLSSSVDGDTAKVKIQVTDDGETDEEELDLKKIDGKWKVAMPKDR